MSESMVERFWSKVDKRGPDECWLWLGAMQSGGYGGIWCDGRMRRATHISCELAGMEVGQGKMVCHRCDNPPCVNPAHLWVGDQTENMRDARAKGRLRLPPPARGEPGWQIRKTHCPKGHPFDAKNTKIVKGNQRRCRACMNAYYSAYKIKKKAAAATGDGGEREYA